MFGFGGSASSSPAQLPPARMIGPSDPDYQRAARRMGVTDGRELHMMPMSSGSGSFAPFGLGPWIPFLPRRVAARLTAVAAMEYVRDAVSNACSAPWPAPEVTTHARVQGSAVHLWFNNPATGRSEIGSVRLAMRVNGAARHANERTARSARCGRVWWRVLTAGARSLAWSSVGGRRFRPLPRSRPRAEPLHRTRSS